MSGDILGVKFARRNELTNEVIASVYVFSTLVGDGILAEKKCTFIVTQNSGYGRWQHMKFS